MQILHCFMFVSDRILNGFTNLFVLLWHFILTQKSGHGTLLQFQYFNNLCVTLAIKALLCWFNNVNNDGIIINENGSSRNDNDIDANLDL